MSSTGEIEGRRGGYDVSVGGVTSIYVSRKGEEKKRRAYKEVDGGQAEKWEAGLGGAFVGGLCQS